MTTAPPTRPPDVVLVHGMGSSSGTWAELRPLLEAAGHRVVAVDNPLRTLAGDVAHTTAAVEALTSGPVVLVGHSYGGAVITGAGHHPRVAALVYAAAFAPDQGETISAMVEEHPPAPASAHLRRGPDGEWRRHDSEAYWRDVVWDLTPAQRASAGALARPTADAVFTEATGAPAWRHLPSWYLVAADDRTLPVVIQRAHAARAGAMTSEVRGSHSLQRVSPGVLAGVVAAATATAVPGSRP